MTITRTGVSSAEVTNTQLIPCVLTFTQSLNDALVVLVGFPATTATFTVSDTAGNHYTQAGTYLIDTASPVTLAIFYCAQVRAAASGANTVSVDLTVSNDCEVVVVGYNSSQSGLSFDMQNSVEWVSPGDPSVNVTTSGSDVVCAMAYLDQGQGTIGAGYTLLYLDPDGIGGLYGLPGGYLLVEDQFFATPGTYAVTANQPTAGQWDIFAIAFQELTAIISTSPPNPTILLRFY